MEIKQIVGMLENVMNERGVPRNVRESLDNAAKTLNSSQPFKCTSRSEDTCTPKGTLKGLNPKTRRKESAKEKISQAISILDESANDPNLATYTRTQIWGIVSLLEGMKK